MLAPLISLFTCSTLALSPWPSTVPVRDAASTPTIAAPTLTSLPVSVSLLPSAPAPAPRAPVAVLPVPRGSAAPHATMSISVAPPPPAETIAYARPYPEPRVYTKRQRGLIIASATLAIASIVPLAFAIRGSVKMFRARDEYLRTQPTDVAQRDALLREFNDQASITVATSVTAVVLCATALVLLGLARSKRKPDQYRPMPSPRGTS